ncbi:MAG: peptide-methionine (S)-S-oxide reductase MsrA [Synechococcus sp.]|jgi:peptide-methionine (S)-S-oxide reductase|nr:peptide-methionine (S)-S-oxide reductase MsrA [Synechococcus sp.]
MKRWLRPMAWLVGLLVCLATWAPAPVMAAPAQEAVLAGGCFWCLEHDLEILPGVLDAQSGYSGGALDQPTYAAVSAGGTGHQEVVRVRFDPDRISYGTLLRAYWRNIDPLDGGGQFCDRGSSYRPVIFTKGAEQQSQAQASLRAAAAELQRPAQALKVQIKPLKRFWPAEGYHQNFAELNKVRYNYYRWACGRDRRLDTVWGARARSGRAWTVPPAKKP